MIKYWRLYSSAEKEVGFVPQIIGPVFKGLYNDKNQLWNTYLKPIDPTTIIPKAHLQKKAKITDLMSVGFASGNLFVSEKLKQIIKPFNTDGIQFAETEIITKTGEYIKVNLMHPYETDYKFIDASNTEFCYTNSMGDMLLSRVYFNSGQEYYKAQIDNRTKISQIETMDYEPLIINKIAFKEEINIDILSVFGIKYGGVGFFVSQTLKDKILEEKCTGVIFRELNERYP
ncbi:MAG: hypothetical protein EOP00_27330 [Pedobacter sp.]|nr:MAG: hypothetical protein EOP00_27330 [Pedobacter sp.]